MDISWRAGSATPLSRAARHGQTGDSFEVGHSNADFVSNCVTVPSSPSKERRPTKNAACLTPLFSSKYICANIPVGTYPITCICRSLPSITAVLAQLARCDYSWHCGKNLTPHVRHVAVLGVVYAKSHPFQFFLPSLSHLSLLGRPKDDRAKAEASIARSPWGTAKLQAPYGFRSYSTIRCDQPWRGRSMELTILIRIHIQGVLGLFLFGHSLTPLFSARVWRTD